MIKTTNIPTRRRWLQSASLLTLGTALSAKSLSNLSFSRTPEVAATSSPPSPEDPIVAELSAPQPDPAATEPLSYEEFLASFNLRHIQPREIINPHRQSTRGIANTLPPIELWPAMPATLFVADEIRARLGRPLEHVTSAYRNPTYNKACGGASQSYHVKNCALDLVYAGGPRAAYDIACDLRNEGLFQGGLGLYNTFLHIDTRGVNKTWLSSS